MAHRNPSPVAKAAALVAGIVVLQALLVFWFAWPAGKSAARDLPVVVAGPAPATAALADRLRAERPGAFRIATAPDAAAADAALRDREAYAAFVVAPSGVSLHVASAAAPAVSALLAQAAQQIGGGRVATVDVVPTPADDPRGAGFAAGFLPLLLTSLVCGAALALAVHSTAARLAGVLAFAALAGLAAAGVLTSLGILTGSFLAAAGVIGLLALAVAAAVCGLGAVLGRVGVALGALLVFVLGNPISGIASAPELLPEPWGAVGQLLPAGAGATLLRSAAFFDGAGAAGPLWVLTGWAAAGLALVALGRGAVRPVRRGSDDERAALAAVGWHF